MKISKLQDLIHCNSPYFKTIPRSIFSKDLLLICNYYTISKVNQELHLKSRSNSNLFIGSFQLTIDYRCHGLNSRVSL